MCLNRFILICITDPMDLFFSYAFNVFLNSYWYVCVPLNYLTCEKNGAIEMQHNNNKDKHDIETSTKLNEVTTYFKISLIVYFQYTTSKVNSVMMNVQPAPFYPNLPHSTLPAPTVPQVVSSPPLCLSTVTGSVRGPCSHSRTAPPTATVHIHCTYSYWFLGLIL